MAVSNAIYLDSTLLPANGRRLSISVEEISRQDRTASGRLVRDIVAIKHKFNLNYSYLTADDLYTFLSMYEAQAEMTLKIVNEVPVSGSPTASPSGSGDIPDYSLYTVLMEAVDRSRELVVHGGMWGNITITLREV